jgi:hypothetical protein
MSAIDVAVILRRTDQLTGPAKRAAEAVRALAGAANRGNLPRKSSVLNEDAGEQGRVI